VKRSLLSLLAVLLASCAYEERPIYATFMKPERNIASPPYRPSIQPQRADQATNPPSAGTIATDTPTTRTPGGLRSPGDILSLPEDAQLKTVSPNSSQENKATLIARPPE
jgi:hypothetical protein